MTTFNQAVKQHLVVKRAAQVDLEQARELWLATTGQGSPAPDSFAEAAEDLAPVEFASLLSAGDAANAYAFDCLWRQRSKARGANPYEQRELARAAWDRFEERAKKAGDVEYGLGFDESLAWESTRDFNICDNMTTVEEVARLAGRMFAQLSRIKAEQVTAAPEEIFDVELGSDVGRLLPSELFHLGEETEAILLDNLANQKALQYAMRGSDEAGRGPLVLALDESGSMHDSRGVWAKSAAVALTRVAWADGRTCAIVHWSTSVRTRILKPGDSAGLLAMIKHWFGAGNSCHLALSNAADMVDTLQSQGDRGADVVLITDGVEDMLPEHDQAIDRIDARNARLWTVGIECPIDKNACIRARAERYIHLDGGDVQRGELGGMQDAVI